MKILQRLLAFLLNDPPPRDLPPIDDAITSEDNARWIAHRWAATRGERWQDPIHAEYVYDENGTPCWVVQSNYPGLGFSLILTIDDASGQVVATRSLPR